MGSLRMVGVHRRLPPTPLSCRYFRLLNNPLKLVRCLEDGSDLRAAGPRDLQSQEEDRDVQTPDSILHL